MIITRFAPSPTGFMHLGNIRTALFSWLFARKNKGKFYLRIDDTDIKRNSKVYVNNIVKTLSWLKIDFDDEIIFQSKNLNIYKKFLIDLLSSGYAYKCYCSKDRLFNLRDNQLRNKEKLAYDGFCKKNKLKSSDNFVIRFNNNEKNLIKFTDIVKGVISINSDEFDDFIISKNNFYPTYNFASVVDDINFSITHIIRGDDHISNTFKQILLFNAFKSFLPFFVHLPMILDSDKKPLSKRNNKLYISYYKNEGFLPDAILNYIVRLGWSFGNKEIFSINDMLLHFNLHSISKSPAIINYDKLLWLNKHYIKNSSVNLILKYFLFIEKKYFLNYLVGPRIKDLIFFSKDRCLTIKDIIFDNFFLYTDKVKLSEDYLQFLFLNDNKVIILKIYYFFIFEKFFWSVLNIRYYISLFLDINFIKNTELFFILRLIIVGEVKSNSIYDLLFLCGRSLILKKIRNIIN